MYEGLKKLYKIEGETKNPNAPKEPVKIVFKEEARKDYLNSEGNVDFDKIEARWNQLKNVKVSLANKYWT